MDIRRFFGVTPSKSSTDAKAKVETKKNEKPAKSKSTSLNNKSKATTKSEPKKSIVQSKSVVISDDEDETPVVSDCFKEKQKKSVTSDNKSHSDNKDSNKKLASDKHNVSTSDSDGKTHVKSDKSSSDTKVESGVTKSDKKRDRSTSSSDNNVSKKVTRRRRIKILESDESGDELIDKNDAVKDSKVQSRITDSSQKKRKKLDSSDEEFDRIKPVKQDKRSKKHTKTTNILSDSESDDEEPVPKKARGRRSKNQSVVLVSDSDKDTPIKPSPLQSFLKPIQRESSQTIKKSAEKSTSAKKTVDIASFFGSASVHRKDKTIVSAKRSLQSDTSSVTSKALDESMDIIDDDDDDFAQTLQQLDTNTGPLKIEKNNKKDETPIITMEESPAKSDKISSHSSSNITTKNGEPIRSSPRKAAKYVDVTPIKPVKSPPNKVTTPSTSTPANKLDMSVNDDSLVDSGKKKGGGMGYRRWLNRDTPRNLGAKPIPDGAENCLEGLTFVITGVLDSFDRDDAKKMVEKFGGKVSQSVSRKTDYMVLGLDPGESKTLKAKQFNIKQIGEDELLALIRDRPGKKSKYQIDAELQAAKDKKEQERLDRLKQTKSKSDNSNQSTTTLKSNNQSKSSTSSANKSQPSIQINNQSQPSTHASTKTETSHSQSESNTQKTDQSEPVLLWVDKYKPTNMKRVIGQQGDKSNAVKLTKWLKEWHRNRALGKKPIAGRWGNDDGSGHKASLLSGPPGVGKTTTAQLVAQECGFSYVELNASDTRSKKTLKQVVAESLNNSTLIDFMGPDKGDKSGHYHCMIMDEVDGVAGNEDRGGIQELIDLIKHTKIPIICICNDRSAQKMRSLVNHCFDLRFFRPRVEQIKGAMMTMLYKEGLTVPPAALNEIILAANQDVRQVIHNLSMWCVKDKTLTYDQAKENANNARKDTKMGPFDVCRRVFSDDDESRKMSLNDKSDLFFYDYSFGPLFVHENYINVTPRMQHPSVSRHLSRLARAADSLCDGDVIDKCIRSSSQWGLLPVNAMFSSVIPGEHMKGSVSFQIAFPQWLGKNSTRTKVDRQLQELAGHMCLKISGNKDSLNRDYLPYLRNTLTQPLIQRENEGIREVIDQMDAYDIVKDDLDNIIDVTKWPNVPDPMSKLSTKTKAALTRTYNKESHLTPYQVAGVTTKKRKGKMATGGEDDLQGEEGDVGDSDEEEDVDVSQFLVKPKATKEKAATTKATTSKGKTTAKTGAKGRGKK